MVNILDSFCVSAFFFFFFNDTATTEIYTLSLHDALPIYEARGPRSLAHGVVLYALVSDPGTGGGASQSTLGRPPSSPPGQDEPQCMTRPPSTLIACPVMYAARLPARKAITLATSSGRASHPSGTCARRCRVNSSGGRPRRAPCSRATTVHMSVSTKPGHTQFTRIPSLA